jgi:hypothetical protein
MAFPSASPAPPAPTPCDAGQAALSPQRARAGITLPPALPEPPDRRKRPTARKRPRARPLRAPHHNRAPASAPAVLTTAGSTPTRQGPDLSKRQQDDRRAHTRAVSARPPPCSRQLVHGVAAPGGRGATNGGERGGELAERRRGERGTKEGLELIVEDASRRRERLLTGSGELEDRGTPIGRVRAARAVACRLEPIDGLGLRPGLSSRRGRTGCGPRPERRRPPAA